MRDCVHVLPAIPIALRVVASWLYRDPTDEARSPPARSACFPHPVQMSQRGVRAAVQKAHLVVYHDNFHDRAFSRQARDA